MTTDVAAPAWFKRLGMPLAAAEHDCIAAMLGDLGLAPGTPIVIATSWRDVGLVLRAQEQDNRWWNGEEAERESLWMIAAEDMTEGELLTHLTRSTAAQRDLVCGGASLAAAGSDGTDPDLVRAASDAALVAVHQHALADLARAPTAHYFRRKFRLFAGGRWPLGVHAGAYRLF
jgi:hypothetical protein